MVNTKPAILQNNGISKEMPRTSQEEPGVDDEASMDFVVLNNPSMNPAQNGSVPSLKDIVDISPTDVLDSSTCGLQIKIKEMTQENLHLKETLEAQNNEMRKHVQMLGMWKENMDHINSEHKKIIHKSREHICQLKSEKNELVSTVEHLKKELSAAQESMKEASEYKSKCNELTQELSRINELKEQVASELEKSSIVRLKLEQDVSNKNAEIEELKKEMETLKEENSRLVRKEEEMEAKLIEVQLALEKAEKELKEVIGNPSVKLDTKTSQSQTSIAEIQQSSTELHLPKLSHKDALVSLLHEQDRVATLTKQLTEEQAQVTLLQKELDERTHNFHAVKEQLESLKKLSHTEHEADGPSGDDYICISLQKGSESLKEALNTTENKLMVTNTLLQTYKDKCIALSAFLADYHERFKSGPCDGAFIAELEERVREMYSLLQQEQATKLEERKQLKEALSKLEGLFSDYQNLHATWEKFQEEQKTKCQHLEAINEIDARKYQEEVDYLMASIVSLKQDIESRDEEIKDLKFQVESTAVLRSQVDILRKDIEKERNLRMQAEKEAQRAVIERQQAAGALYYLQHTDAASAGALPSYLDTSHEVHEYGEPPTSQTVSSSGATSCVEPPSLNYGLSSISSFSSSVRSRARDVSRRKESRAECSRKKKKPSFW